MKKDSEKGVISLEASIAIVLFLFAMLFFYTMFYFTLARNQLSHALLQTCQSMSFDAYESSVMTGKNNTSDNMPQWINELFGIVGGSNGFVNDMRWYDEPTTLLPIIKGRFVSYMADDMQGTDARLKALGVVDGFSGLDFSKSSVVGDDLCIVLTYKIEPWINFYHLKPIKITMEAKSRLWK